MTAAEYLQSLRAESDRQKGDKAKKQTKKPCESDAAKESYEYCMKMALKYPKLSPFFNTSVNRDYAIAKNYMKPEDNYHYLTVSYIRAYTTPKTVRVTHSPNEGKRGNVEQAKLKMMGVSKGFADLQLIKTNGILHPMFFAELKWNSAASPEQVAFLDEMKQAGHHADIYKKDLPRFVEDLWEWYKRD